MPDGAHFRLQGLLHQKSHLLYQSLPRTIRLPQGGRGTYGRLAGWEWVREHGRSLVVVVVGRRGYSSQLQLGRMVTLHQQAS